MKIGMRIIFLNSKSAQCGVHDYGVRLYEIIRAIGMEYAEVGTLEEYQSLQADVILYNYHYATMPWLDDNTVRRDVKNYAIFHEAFMKFTPDRVIDTSIRPIIEGAPLRSAGNKEPVIGSFGFGFSDKNFVEIARRVCAQYDKATIRLNIPFAKYGDADGVLAKMRVREVERVIREGIRLEVDHTYLSQAELVQWLHQNDINLFLYSPSHGRGLSSATDYALSAYRPIGVSDSEMFRHLPVELQCEDIRDLINGWWNTLAPVYEEHSNRNLINKYKEWLR